MDNINIFTKFRKELGYINITNQYIELASRKLQSHYGHELQTNFVSIAKDAGLTISTLCEDYSLRIVQGYIVSIYTCLDRFLVDFKNLPGSPTYQKELPDKVSLLEYTWDTVCKKASNDEKNAYHLCNYYRLVRNNIVHKGESNNQLRLSFSQVKKIHNSRLEAPNNISELTFDDQVLFSRSAFSLSKVLFTKGEYDITKVAEAYKKKLYSLISTVLDEDNRAIAKRKLKKYLETYYPPFENVDWDNVLDIVVTARTTCAQ